MKSKRNIQLDAAWVSLLLACMPAAETKSDIRLSGAPYGAGLNVMIHVTQGFTNRVEIYECPDLRSGLWTVRVENLLPCYTSPAVWYTPAADTGFFAVGNMDSDSDSDGLCDGREFYVYRTDPENSDSDGDLYSDYQELCVAHTDPNNDDTSVPLVWITAPAAGMRKVVLP